jgi:manganese/zinc/iron transport system substrate-binding protein
MLTACSESTKNETTIVCTTGMIGDAVQHLMGDSVKVEVLMGPGVDPHLYKATQGDITALNDARVIIYNGLHLEGKMAEIFEKLGRLKTTIAVGDYVDKSKLINSTDYANADDPHIWFDVVLWAAAWEEVAVALQQEFPERAAEINANYQRYAEELYQLDQFAREQIATIPDSQRVMITAHDAFKYFGKAYGMEVRGLQGISTAAEYGLQDVSELVKYIVDRKIKALFVESSVPKKSIEAVIEGCRQRGHDVKLGGELFSDAMGTAGTPEGTYVGMVRHNVEVVTEALK